MYSRRRKTMAMSRPTTAGTIHGHSRSTSVIQSRGAKIASANAAKTSESVLTSPAKPSSTSAATARRGRSLSPITGPSLPAREHGHKWQAALMATLLFVHHTPSPSMQAMFEAVLAGAKHPDIEGVDVVRRPALSATAADVLAADGYLLGTPANLGSMSGALKHFFDTVYYPCLDSTRGRPFGAYVHGNNDTAGTARQLASITTGLGWTQVADPVLLTGEPDKAALEALQELGATVASTLMG